MAEATKSDNGQFSVLRSPAQAIVQVEPVWNCNQWLPDFSTHSDPYCQEVSLSIKYNNLQ